MRCPMLGSPFQSGIQSGPVGSSGERHRVRKVKYKDKSSWLVGHFNQNDRKEKHDEGKYRLLRIGLRCMPHPLGGH